MLVYVHFVVCVGVGFVDCLTKGLCMRRVLKCEFEPMTRVLKCEFELLTEEF